MPRFFDLPYHLAETIHQRVQREGIQRARDIGSKRQIIRNESRFLAQLLAKESQLADVHRDKPDKLRNALKALPKKSPAREKRRDDAVKRQQFLGQIERSVQHRNNKGKDGKDA
ncbi:hypothetical protein C8R46DRAFT_1030087 [Mycena filopes]|nr:hypothetical protein C8R46DRAFT_1030087 [Mycena filopes]